MLRRFNTILYTLGLAALLASCGVEVGNTAAETPAEEPDIDQGPQVNPMADGVVRKIYVNGVEVSYSLWNKNSVRKSRYQHMRLTTRIPHGAFRLLITDIKQHKQTVQDRRNWLNNILCQLFGVGNCNYEVQKVLVAVKTLDVRNEAGEYMRVADFGENGRLVDLMNFQNGAFSDLGALSLAPGNYLGMRITLKEKNLVQVVENSSSGVLKPLLMQSAAHATVELPHAFTVSDLQLTMLKLDFDVQKSISRNFWGTYYLRPHIKIIDTEATDVIEQVITKAQGGSLEVLGEVGLQVPANAVAADTTLSLKPTFKLMPHKSAGVYIIGQEYEIQPADLQLNAMATLSIQPDAVYANAGLIDESTLAIHRRVDDTSIAPLESQISATGKVSALIDRLGKFVVGASPTVGNTSSLACQSLGSLVGVAPSALGVDIAYLSNACERHNECYEHGNKTYGKTAAQCNEDFHEDAIARCENLCMNHADGGVACSEVDATNASDEMKSLLQMYGQCQRLSNDMHTAAVATTEQAYPGDAASTCSDYDNAGVSCVPASCSLTVDPVAIPPYTPTDLNFSLKVQGSVRRVMFDGSVAYEHAGLPTPVDLNILIAEEGRELTEARTFTATLEGPGISGNPVTCSVTVNVSEPPACILTIAPDSIPLGGPAAALSLSVLPGFNFAQTDLRQEGIFRDAGLSAPDANGWRHFNSSVNPSASRTYTARVWDDNGNMRSCSDYLEVVP